MSAAPWGRIVIARIVIARIVIARIVIASSEATRQSRRSEDEWTGITAHPLRLDPRVASRLAMTIRA